MPVPNPHANKITLLATKSASTTPAKLQKMSVLKNGGFFSNATTFLNNANGTLSAGGNTLQNLSGITNTITNFSKPRQKTEDDKPKTNWLLIAGLGLGAYLLFGGKKGK